MKVSAKVSAGDPQSSTFSLPDIERLLDSPVGTSQALTQLRDTDVNLNELIDAVARNYELPRERAKRLVVRLLEAFFSP